MTISCGSPRECLRALLAWLRARRVRLIAIALVIAGFYALGYFTPRITAPGTCLIYG